MAQWVRNLTSIHEDAGLIPDLTQYFEDPLLRPRCRPAAAAPIRPPSLRTSTGHGYGPKKGKKERERERERALVTQFCTN